MVFVKVPRTMRRLVYSQWCRKPKFSVQVSLVSTCSSFTQPLTRRRDAWQPSQACSLSTNLAVSRWSSPRDGNQATVLDGIATSKYLNAEIKGEVADMKRDYQVVPGLVVFLVGDHPESVKYVNMKQKAAKRAGFHFLLQHLNENITQKDLIDLIQVYNADTSVHGILVQLPLPVQLSTSDVCEAVAVAKDVDGFHAYNMGVLALKDKGSHIPWERSTPTVPSAASSSSFSSFLSVPTIPPPTTRNFYNVSCAPLACIELLNRYELLHDCAGKHAVVLGRSSIVGLPVTLLLMHYGFTVTNCDVHTIDLPSFTRQADLVVCAVGCPEMVRGDWLKPGAVVLDVGFNHITDNVVVGDVEYSTARERAGHITPVPGGVGPVTVSMLLMNTLRNAQLVLVKTK